MDGGSASSAGFTQDPPDVFTDRVFSGMTMLAGFDEDVTAWVANGAMVEIDPAHKLLRVL